jgi:hypothetical protein
MADDRDMARLNEWRGILKKICGPVVEPDIWRIRSNQELHQLNQDSDVANIRLG